MKDALKEAVSLPAEELAKQKNIMDTNDVPNPAEAVHEKPAEAEPEKPAPRENLWQEVL